MPLTAENIESLQKMFPWPETRPDFEPAEWVLDGGGRDMITKRISGNDYRLIVEIGVFMGSSVKNWLAASPRVHVIAIDPWEGKWWAEYAIKNRRNELVAQLEKEDGPYLTFLSSLWDYRDRVTPVRGYSPDKLYELAKLGIVPDLIYFDSDKTGKDIEIAHKLFPSALLTGDDWTWGNGAIWRDKGYPIRKAVKEFARKHGYFLRTNRATWTLDQTGYSLTDYINSAVEVARDFKQFIRANFKRKQQ